MIVLSYAGCVRFELPGSVGVGSRPGESGDNELALKRDRVAVRATEGGVGEETDRKDCDAEYDDGQQRDTTGSKGKVEIARLSRN